MKLDEIAVPRSKKKLKPIRNPFAGVPHGFEGSQAELDRLLKSKAMAAKSPKRTTSKVDIYLSPLGIEDTRFKCVARNVDRKNITDTLFKLADKYGVTEEDFEWYKAGTKP